MTRRATRLLLVWTILASAFLAAPAAFGSPTVHAAAAAPSVASRSTAMSATVDSPAGVTSADHVAIHTLFVDQSSTAPVWVTPAGFALRYQHSRSVGYGYVFHFAAFDSNRNDVSGRSSFVVSADRPGLAQTTQAFRVIDTAGFAAGGVAAEGFLDGASLTLPNVPVTVDNTALFATITAGGPTTIANGPAGWARFSGEADDNYLYSRVVNVGSTNGGVVTYSATSAQTALVHAFLPMPNTAPVATSRSVSTAEDTSVAVLVSATDADGDALTYRTTGGPSNGTLSGTAPNLTYTPAANFHGTDSFTFVAEDGAALSNTATVTITVTPVNDAPVATNASASATGTTPVGVTLSASDVDGDALTWVISTPPDRGTLSGVAPNLTYTAAAGSSGTDTFRFYVNDGTVNSNTATATIAVVAANRAPVASSRSVSTTEDGAVAVTLSATDADGDALTYRTSGGPSNGTLSGTAPDLTFTPAANFHGTNTFDFVADDGRATSNTATVTISVTPVNDAPAAVNASASTAAGTPVGIVLSASDVDGDALTWAITSQPARGTLSGVAPNLTYTPTAGLSGTDTFGFRVNDGTVNSNTATVTITVAEPVVVSPSVASRTTARSGTVAAPAGVTAADHVAVHTLFADQTSTPPVWSSPSGLVLRYQHTRSVGSGYYLHFAAFDSNRADVSARSSFVVSAGRSALAQTTQAFRVINTSGYAAAGFAAEGFLNGSSLTLPSVPVTVNNTTLFATITAGGNTTVANGPAGWTRFSGESDDNYLYSRSVNAGGASGGVVTFSGASAHTALIHAFLPPAAAPPNRAPVAADVSASTSADTPVGVTLSASDADGDALTWVIASQPTRGTLSGVAPNLTYTPTAGLSGTDTFTFRVNDGTVNSNTATATITVAAVNRAPVAANRSVSTAEDTAIAVTLSATDADGDALTYLTTGGPSNGTLSGTAPNLTYTPAANSHGTDSFTFVAEDGAAMSNTATVTITVTPVNDAPVAANASATITDSGPVALSASDVDGDPLTWVIASQPARGTLSGIAPNLTYTAAAGISGTDTFTFYVNDGTVDSNIATSTITVSATAPVVPSVASRSTAPSGTVEAPSGVTPADHVAVHTLFVDQTSTPPVWSSPSDLVVRYQFSKSVGFGYYFHFAAFDSNGTDVSGRSSFVLDAGRSALAQTTQAFRVANTSGYVSAGVAADGVFSGSSLTLPGVAVTADNTVLFATITAGGATTVANGPAGWTGFSGEADENYLFSRVASAGFNSNTSEVTFSGASAQTALVHAFAPGVPPVPAPGAPTNVAAVAGNELAQLSWTAPAGNGGPALVDYVVELRGRGEEWVTYDDGVGTATAATVVGLTNYDEYEFRVAARDSAATGSFSVSGVATPTDGNDPADTFNRPDGMLAGQGDWVTVNPQYGMLQIVNGRVVGSRDPDGTGSGYTTAVGPNMEVTIDALLGDDYTEVSALLRMPSPDNLVGSYLMQWVTDGRFTSLGTVAGPTLQIWRIHSHTDIRLLAEVSLPDNGERTLTFGANGSTIYIAEGSTVLLSTVDTGNLTGQYFGLAQSNLDQGVMSQIDNLRWRAV